MTGYGDNIRRARLYIGSPQIGKIKKREKELEEEFEEIIEDEDLSNIDADSVNAQLDTIKMDDVEGYTLIRVDYGDLTRHCEILYKFEDKEHKVETYAPSEEDFEELDEKLEVNSIGQDIDSKYVTSRTGFTPAEEEN